MKRLSTLERHTHHTDRTRCSLILNKCRLPCLFFSEKVLQCFPRCSVYLRIQSESGKIGTSKTPNVDTFQVVQTL